MYYPQGNTAEEMLVVTSSRVEPGGIAQGMTFLGLKYLTNAMSSLMLLCEE
jgi:hypothetical protein